MHVVLGSWKGDLPIGVEQAVRVTLGAKAVVATDGAQLFCAPPQTVTASTDQAPQLFNRTVDNLIWLEQSAAGDGERFEQWRYLVTPEEAVALFNLPMPTEFGQVPGIASQDHPFYLPIELTDNPDAEDSEEGLTLGHIWHRGLETEHLLRVPPNKLDQHILIAGRTGSGKTNTCLQLLCELGRLDIPFIVLDPLDKRDYRLLLGEENLRSKLRIYTLGESTSPLIFNPFAVPRGVTVQRHISQLMRCFLTAFVVGDPIPAIYRAALRRTYALNGWRLDQEDKAGSGRRMPTFREFFQVLEMVADERSREYSQEIKGNIRQMTRLRIGSLLEDNARILNVPANDPRDALVDVVQHPTIIELGHIGSDEDKALIMAFLLTCLLPRIQFRHERNRKHVIVIEEAHRLMRRGGSLTDLRGDPTQQTRSDFSNLLAEVRGYNQGIIVVDQSPSELVPSVFSNTATHIMHHLRDPQSFEMMSSAFVLSPAQIAYAHRLPPFHAITETPSGVPVHVKPENVTERLREALRMKPGGLCYLDPDTDAMLVGDEAVGSVMKDRQPKMPQSKNVPNFEALLGGKCLGCLPPMGKNKCEHWLRVELFRNSARRPNFEKPIAIAIEQSSKPTEPWETILRLGPDLARTISSPTGKEADVVYCAISHLAEAVSRDPNRSSAVKKYQDVLRTFYEHYKANER
jgi:hypothetical protein